MKKFNILSLLIVASGLVLLGAGCGNSNSTTQNPTSVNPVVTPGSQESSSSLPATQPTASDTAPTPAQPTPVPAETAPAPTKPAPSPAPKPNPTPAPTPAPQPPPQPPQPAPKTVSAAISGFAFQPGTITINRGDTVVWTNNDDVSHTVTASNGSFDSGMMGAGARFSRTFSTAGTFSYYCGPHPSMRGTVIVR